MWKRYKSKFPQSLHRAVLFRLALKTKCTSTVLLLGDKVSRTLSNTELSRA